MTTPKVKFVTNLKNIKYFNPCSDGLNKFLNHVGQNYPENKEINLLTVLESNGINHFFWCWRLLPKKHNKTKRMILHDMVKLVKPIYEEQYPDSNIIKDVLKALATGRGLRDTATAAAYAAYAAATDATYAAANAAADAAYAAANAANAAATYVAYAANTAYPAYAAKAAEAAANVTAYVANAAAYDAVNTDDARKKMNEKIIKVIKKYLK